MDGFEGQNTEARAARFLGALTPKEFALNATDEVKYLERADLEEVVLEREPFFFIDKAVAVSRKEIWAVAMVTAERSAGHFPGRPSVPLIDLCKLIAQAGSILAALWAGPNEIPIAVSAGESKAHSRNLVDAPVVVLVHATLTQSRQRLHQVNGTIYANRQKIGSLTKILYTLVDRDKVLNGGS